MYMYIRIYIYIHFVTLVPVVEIISMYHYTHEYYPLMEQSLQFLPKGLVDYELEVGHPTTQS